MTEVEARLADTSPPAEADAVREAQSRDAADDAEATLARTAEAMPRTPVEEPRTPAEEPEAPTEHR